jgi:hypothetical protein
MTCFALVGKWRFGSYMELFRRVLNRHADFILAMSQISESALNLLVMRIQWRDHYPCAEFFSLIHASAEQHIREIDAVGLQHDVHRLRLRWLDGGPASPPRVLVR